MTRGSCPPAGAFWARFISGEGQLSCAIRARDRSGHHRYHRVLVLDERSPCAAAATRSSAELPAAGLGRARCRGDLAHRSATSRRRRSAAAGPRRRDIAAIGITNQRETTVAVGRETGAPIAPRDRLAGPAHRRALRARCERAGHEAAVRELTGCCSTRTSRAPRSRGCSTTSPGARARAPRAASSRSAPSTPGSLWQLTGGAVHATDVTQRLAHAAVRHPRRSRGTTSCSTLLGIPRAVLPEVRAVERRRSARRRRRAGLPDGIPIAGHRRATSRPRCSARRASRPARRSTPTAPAASC